jgi:excinuclease ABC subunit B
MPHIFKLVSGYKPAGDQPQAIEKLEAGIKAGLKDQVLLGVTGSGKTFTMANIIADLQMPALVISHNKTLAGQLYQEMRDFFPENAVSYFVSYYDYYQPEAYIPTTDTYIEKEAQINDLIDKLRLKSTANILTRPDSIVVASVSCIYNIGSPLEYGHYVLEVALGDTRDFSQIARRLAELQYERSEFDFRRGTFRVRGNYMDIYPSYEDYAFRIYRDGSKISKFAAIDSLTGSESKTLNLKPLTSILIYPAKHYLTNPNVFKATENQIRADLKKEHAVLLAAGKIVEAHRLLQKTNYDLEMIKEVGYTSGIENYSRYFDGRNIGDPPHSLLDYFTHAYGDKFIVFIDESHMSVPQIRGMYNGDHARKKTLIDFGFRLKAAFDNRPLTFEEFYKIPPHFIYTSATPSDWEVETARSEVLRSKFHAHSGVVEQLIRPTGIVDPEIEVRPSSAVPASLGKSAYEGEIPDLVKEIETRAARGERTLATTLTKKTAEELTEYLKEKKVRAAYLHSDIETLERSNVLDNLRKNEYDALIGVNLLREGLDLPEVTLVAILDADKEGFLRSRTSLIQTMGRAARNISGVVILYADAVTGSMETAIEEIRRRRVLQTAYNKKHGITPATIFKPIREKIVEQDELPAMYDKVAEEYSESYLATIRSESLTPYDRKKIVKRLERDMKKQAEDMNFELAIKIRDKVRELKK